MIQSNLNNATRSAPERVALFGGSFDPPHSGHLLIAHEAKKAAKLDRVIFLPCTTSPHKTDTPPAPGASRSAMLQALVSGNESWAEVSDIDLSLPYPSFTWRTLNAIHPQLPENTELYWILGADQWNQLEHWAEPDKLRKALHFLVFPREGNVLAPRDGWNATFLDAVHPASSSAIRKAIAMNDANWRDATPASVATIIDRDRLYSVEQP